MKLSNPCFFVLGYTVLAPFVSPAQQRAFPGAEGYGRFATGGRGGTIIEVTNLNNSGSGSLRAAIDASGKRIVVLRISGTIALESDLNIRNGDITIAGQTAPGDGICIKNYDLTVSADNVIIRYMRFRLGDEKQIESDAVWGRYHKNIILDHCSASWSVDETLSFYEDSNMTVQWCLVSESLRMSVHVKGPHGYGGIWGGTNVTFHHNLLAHHSSRNPRFSSNSVNLDHRNNVIYNWGFNSCYGGEGSLVNMIANYYKYGPATESEGKRYRIAEPSVDTGIPMGKWYIADNFVFGYPAVTKENWKGGVQGGYAAQAKVDVPFPAAWVVTHTAESAFEQVLADVGANRPKRDTLDARVVWEVRNGKALYGGVYTGSGTGIIDSQKDVGGWPELKSLPPSVDTDHDGMPDEWETSMGFNPNDPTDRNGDRNQDGYTNLEDYLNSLCIRQDFVLAPSSLRSVVVSPNRVDLTWQEDAVNETAFRIERSEKRADGFAEIGSTNTNDTTFNDTTVKPNLKYYYRVRSTNGPVYSTYTNVDSAFTSGSTNVRESLGLIRFVLHLQNYPNPFNPVCRIAFGIPLRGHVRLAVYDVAGREVERLVDEKKDAGEFTIRFDATLLPGGVYLARLETNSEVRIQKMVFMK